MLTPVFFAGSKGASLSFYSFDKNIPECLYSLFYSQGVLQTVGGIFKRNSSQILNLTTYNQGGIS
jgi:hypothetical protein